MGVVEASEKGALSNEVGAGAAGGVATIKVSMQNDRQIFDDRRQTDSSQYPLDSMQGRRAPWVPELQKNQSQCWGQTKYLDVHDFDWADGFDFYAPTRIY